MPIRSFAGATGFTQAAAAAEVRAQRQRFLETLERLNAQLDGSTLEAALGLMVAEYRAEARRRRQHLALLGPRDAAVLSLLQDLDELSARIDLVRHVHDAVRQPTPAAGEDAVPDAAMAGRAGGAVHR